MIPGLDPKTLNDEELMQKIIDLRTRYTYASQMFGSHEMARALGTFLDILEAEQQERLDRALYEQIQKQLPDIIDTDPVNKEVKDEQRKAANQGNTGPSKDGWRQRTFRKPTLD